MRYYIDWRAFCDVVLTFFVMVWFMYLIVGTFFFDRAPWWYVVLHIIAAILSVAIPASIKEK